MFCGQLGIADKYNYLDKRFQLVYDFLRTTDLKGLQEGKLLLPMGIIALFQHYETSPAEELKFETHDEYFDVQYLVAGKERIGLANRKDLSLATPYDHSNDISYYKDPPYNGEALLMPGNFLVIEPEEAHKPRCCVNVPESVVKIVLKVPVSPVDA